MVYCVIKNKTINLHLSEKDVSLLTGNIENFESISLKADNDSSVIKGLELSLIENDKLQKLVFEYKTDQGKMGILILNLNQSIESNDSYQPCLVSKEYTFQCIRLYKKDVTELLILINQVVPGKLAYTVMDEYGFQYMKNFIDIEKDNIVDNYLYITNKDSQTSFSLSLNSSWLACNFEMNISASSKSEIGRFLIIEEFLRKKEGNWLLKFYKNWAADLNYMLLFWALIICFNIKAYQRTWYIIIFLSWYFLALYNIRKVRNQYISKMHFKKESENKYLYILPTIISSATILGAIAGIFAFVKMIIETKLLDKILPTFLSLAPSVT